MKTLLIILASFVTIPLAAQSFDVERWKEIRKLKTIPLIPLQKLQKIPGLKHNMPTPKPIPNGLTTVLPSPKKIGNNGLGHDIYSLPLDNMPMIKPDSSFYSRMPVAGALFHR